ncbi:MAG TPA: peptidyl-prolyl cis-trans isomerase [Verrucomicrobiales bacterium]|nr:peptidyl-prolyl cis-trans isomerase [Verrucomicrobiales bacterium]HIL70838.1 peptidyl-prolyl cis-trans isomerase [Verrucomicrobiota bacterium]
MKRNDFFLITVIFLLTGSFNQAQDRNGVVVLVNDSVITNAKVQTRMIEDRLALAQLYANQPSVLSEKLSELRKDVVQQMVERELILNEFKTGPYQFPESYIERRIQEDIDNNYEDRLTLIKSLQKSGSTFESYKKSQKENIIISAMTFKNVPPKSEILISPYKIEQFYKNNIETFKKEDQVDLSEIVLPFTAESKEVTLKIGKEVIKKVSFEVPFGEMASVYSSGVHQHDFGKRGWTDKRQLHEKLAATAFDLKSKETSDLIEIGTNFFILHANDVKKAHYQPLSEIRNQIEETLKDLEIKRLRNRWIQRLENKSFVRYFF